MEEDPCSLAQWAVWWWLMADPVQEWSLHHSLKDNCDCVQEQLTKPSAAVETTKTVTLKVKKGRIIIAKKHFTLYCYGFNYLERKDPRHFKGKVRDHVGSLQ